MSMTEQVIRPRASGITATLRGLWEYRSLLAYFAMRSVRLRYKETVLGWLWLIIRPLVTAIFFTLVFGRMVGLPSDGLPYLVFFFSAFVVWNFFHNTLIFVTRSLRSNRRLITKIYFPRIIVPVGSVAPFALELLVNCILFCGIVVYYAIATSNFYVSFNIGLLSSFYFLLLTLLFVIGIGLWTSVLNAEARDVRFTMPYVLQAWFFVTPVIYPVSLVPQEWRWALPLNPMLPIVEGFRAGVTGVGGLPVEFYAISTTLVLLTLLSGFWFFSKAEERFADAL